MMLRCVLLAAGLLACTVSGLGTSPPTRAVPSIVFPLATPSLALETTPGVLFHDDFSYPLSGWDVRRDPDAITDFAPGAFVIFVGKPDTALWSVAHRYMGDVRIQVEATQAGGPDDNLYGVICRYQDRDNFYRFVISGNGYAGITKRSQGQVLVISGDYLTVSSAVRRGMATNQLSAVCQGPG
jgi:hypothetical protein